MGKRKKGKNNYKVRAKSQLKKQEKKQTELQQYFIGLTEKFMSDFMASGFNEDSDLVLNSFDKYNTVWKNHARVIITKNLNVYNNKQRRQQLIGTFERFVEKYLDNFKLKFSDGLNTSEGNGEINEPIEGKLNDENLLEADIDNWYDSPVPNIQEALSSLGIKTTAKTIKGLTNVVNKLDGENYSKFLKYLGLT